MTALTLQWLGAAALVAAGPLPFSPPERVLDRVVGRVVTARAEALAVRRGFRPGRPPKATVLDQPGMRAALDAATRPTRPSSELRDAEILRRLLGLAAPVRGNGQPPAPSGVEVSGLYDVASRQLFVASWVDLEVGRFAFTRDVAHAVLDRRFELSRWLAPSASLPPGVAQSDALLARQALVTGDATVQALEYVDPEGERLSPQSLAELTAQARVAIAAENPETSPATLGWRLFVELDGLTFVAGIRDRAPWSTVDDAWRRPPQSTEQILHPEKYARAEKPDEVGARLPKLVRGGWSVSYSDTLGELGVRLFLLPAVGSYRAERAGTGWGGDRVLLLSRPSGARDRGQTPRAAPFAAWVTTWDDEGDAEDFAHAAAQALARLARGAATDDRPVAGRFRVTDDAGRLFMLECRGRTVGLLFAAPARAEAVLSELMKASSRDRGPAGARRPRPGQARARSR